MTPPLQRTPANICISLILLETRIPGLHFFQLTVWVYLYANFSGWLRNTCVKCSRAHNSRSRSFEGSTKVVDFGTNRNRVYDFLLVINSNLCRISYRFGDTAAYWSKIANSYPQFVLLLLLLPHPHLTPLLGVIPFEFWDELDIPGK